MSMSTQHGGGGSRRQSAVSTGSPGKKAATAGKGAPPRQAAKGGGPRKPIVPVKVAQSRNWGPIALFVAVGLLAAGIIGYGGWYVYKGTRTWQDKAGAISGLVNYNKTTPDAVKNGVHQQGTVPYSTSPPVGGPHNPSWQRCMGDVYDAPIANEHAVHSMEHGAVWITYRPDLPADQVETLAAKVRGNDFMLMSPYPGLDKAISLQAWGYQLKVNSASDKRIDEFIRALRQNASREPGVACSSGNYVTATGTTPRDMTQQQSGG
ncbi:MAG TPA: DUF3105 domain-containing protein [Micromonosporaceae bacterium]|jgi:hypothetical protein|nr:DUF3105 domain-containing protein [Micromonosporaceae bacterium]